MEQLNPEQLHWTLVAIDAKQCQTTEEAMIKASMLAYIAKTLDDMAEATRNKAVGKKGNGKKE